MLTAIVGTNWGDEGKGRMVDLLSADYDVVVRYQGGNNAGHTVVNEQGKFVLNLLPSGILRPGTANVLGPGMVVDIQHLCGEIQRLRAAGVAIGPEHLILSDRATISLPYHKLLDGLEEDRLGDRKFGSTRRGISPAYADKYMKKTLRLSDLLHADTLLQKIGDLLDWKNMVIAGGYGHAPVTTEELTDWLETWGKPLLPYIRDATDYLSEAVEAGKSVIFEAQLGALRDIDYGIYPFTSASTTLAAYAPIGAGIPFVRLDESVGIMKAYSSCVGEGPFPCELFGEAGETLRQAGGEYGAATGRPRRVGGFDVVASRYGAKLQGCAWLALTKLDVLSYMKEIPVCVGYELRGERIDRFPANIDDQNALKPVYESFPGFCCDIGACRRPEDLPEAALSYIRFIEKAVGCPVKYVSVGAERDAYIRMF